MFSPSAAGRRSDHALDFHRPVVDLFQRVGVARLDLDVAALLGDHVQQRNPAELVALPDHVQVLTGHFPDAACVDLQGVPGRALLGIGRLHFLADDEPHELGPSLGRQCLGLRGRDIALIAISDG